MGGVTIPVQTPTPYRPEQPDPLRQQAEAQQVIGGQQGLQQQQLQIQQQKRMMQDQQSLMQILGKHDGNLTKALPELAGKVMPQTYLPLLQHEAQMRLQNAQATDAELKVKQQNTSQLLQLVSDAQKMSPTDYAQNFPMIAQQAKQLRPELQIDPNQPIPQDKLDMVGLGLKTEEQAQKAEAERRANLESSQKQQMFPSQLASSQAEATIKGQQAKMAQSGGGAVGTGLDVQEANAWLKKNPGKDLADYAKYKATLVPSFNFNLQQAGGSQPLTPRQQAQSQAILEGRMSAPSSFAQKTPYWQAVMGDVLQRDPNWSEQRAQLRKNYIVPQGNNAASQIGAINTALGHVGVLGDAIDALKNGNVQVLNRIANNLGAQVGQSPQTTFQTIVHRVGPEITKAYVGAGGGEGERGTTEKDFDPALGPDQLRSNVGMTTKLLRSKIASLENQWDQNKAPGAADFQQQFIMPAAKQTLDKWSPGGESGGAAKARFNVGDSVMYQGKAHKVTGVDPQTGKLTLAP